MVHLPRRSVLASALAACLAPWRAGADARLRPPVARVEPVRERFFGHTVVDPYRWMENAKDPDWEPFMRGQDAYARQVLAGIPGRDAIKARIQALSGGSAVAYGARSAGGRVFYLVRPAGADNFKLAVREGAEGPERILVDPTTMKGEGGTHVSLDWWLPSPDGRHVLYGLSPAGSENSVGHVLEVASGRVLPERLPGLQYANPSWLPDSSGFFYGRVADPARLGQADYYLRALVLLHRLGTEVSADPVVMGHGRDPAVPLQDHEAPLVMAWPGSDWAALWLQGGVRRENPLYLAPLADVLAGRAAWRRVCTVEDQVVDFVFDDRHLYLLSTRGAVNGRLLQLPLAGGTMKSARVVVPEGRQVLEGVSMARDGLYLRDLDGGYHALRRLRRDGRIEAVTLPYEGAVSGMSTAADADGLWIDGTSWLLPTTVFHHDGGQSRAVPLAPAGPDLGLADYEARREYARARDGTRVPLSIVARKGLPRDGRNPTLVEAYGSYQISINPFFSRRALAFLERGGVLVIAHVRGGGEYGRRWWKGGQKLSKPNTWRDLIAGCEHLVRQGWASPRTLVIQGGSAGGITVGMALTERPDLFAGVISNVGVSNALRSEFGPNGPGNVDEFGSVKTRDGFLGLRAMDALHHVRDGVHYPAVLFTVGMTDSRVEAWQPAKMTARLQRATRSGEPVLLRVNFDAGHGLGSTRSQIDEERADEFAFVLWRAGRAGGG